MKTEIDTIQWNNMRQKPRRTNGIPSLSGIVTASRRGSKYLFVRLLRINIMSFSPDSHDTMPPRLVNGLPSGVTHRPDTASPRHSLPELDTPPIHCLDSRCPSHAPATFHIRVRTLTPSNAAPQLPPRPESRRIATPPCEVSLPPQVPAPIRRVVVEAIPATPGLSTDSLPGWKAGHPALKPRVGVPHPCGCGSNGTKPGRPGSVAAR